MSRWLLGAALISGLGCGAAYADRVAPKRTAATPLALAVAPEKVRAPYDVTVLNEAGEALETYAKGGRYYVLGDDGGRYIIRVANPTANRVEAVVTVDGLDVIDGENGDLKKRGYVVPAYGELRIEGFRTSTEDVATFRFSSVDDSYAGKKGKARNVGVIAVALFEEEAPPRPTQIIVPQDPEPYYDGRYHYEDDLDEEGGTDVHVDVTVGARGGNGRGDAGGDRVSARKVAPPPPTTAEAPASGGTATADSAGAAPAPDYYRPPTTQRLEKDSDDGEACCTQRKTSRPGLGTEFGESRYSAASYTRFVRAGGKPIAIAELRYNDSAGLIALGIPVQPMPDEGELMTRETADPFPGDGRFSTPP
jgi:hypothetical protein